MPRVAKNRRLKRKARLARQCRSPEDFAELGRRFQTFMREHGCDGYVVAGATGVSVSSVPPAPAIDDPVADVRAAFAGVPGSFDAEQVNVDRLRELMALIAKPMPPPLQVNGIEITRAPPRHAMTIPVWPLSFTFKPPGLW